MPNITPNPITVTPAKTSGGSVKNAANLISYSASAQGPQAELWGNVTKAFRDLQSQVDGIANSLRSPLAIPDPIQVVDATGNLVASIGTYVNTLTNTSFTGIWSKQFSVGTDANPLTYGAVGDGVNNDTNAVQQAINTSGGVLYVPANKNFLCSTTITAPTPTSLVYIYGGGTITSSANPIISIPHGNWIVEDIFIVSNTTGATGISVVSNASTQAGIRKCWIDTPTGTGIALNGSGAGISVSDCSFPSNTTGVALTNQTDVDIANCEFNGATTPVSTSGTCTYNLRGNSSALDFYNPQIPRAFIGQSATQTIAAAGFTNLTFGTGVLGYNIGSPAIWSSGSPTRFTAPVAGSYLVIGQWTGSANISTSTQLLLNKNSAGTSPLVAVQQLMSTETPQQQVSAVLQLAKNDFIEFVVGNTGAATGTTAAQTWGSMILLSQP